MNSQEIKVRIRKLFSKEKHRSSQVEELNQWYNSLNEEVTRPMDSDRLKSQAWENIHNEIHTVKVHKRHEKNVLFGSWIWKAAILLLFCGVGYGLFSNLSESTENTKLSAGSYSNEIGKVSAFLLPDGSKVWLSTGSKLEYAADFPSNRQVSLSGEAFFEVVSNPNSPFRITTGDMATEVLGTSFNLKSYNQTGVELSVYSGRVKFSDQHSNTDSAILLMGEKISWSAQAGLSETELFDVAKLPDWRLGKISFDNAAIEVILSTLKIWYDVTVEVDGKGTNCHYSGEFKQASLEQILETLSFALNLTYKINDAHVTIRVNPCE
ncbi:ferric-dicitrate binding protein FerR (iron transport regulator) [Algoriphagus sp. 4150]|uniref:FecR family protein n=1 Tax=Algoriphagus sp. 4150 TaxID=2817756 RepID=UPI0028597DAF|nr:FecR domain-containing protein [Algoriphagus sp. 4150]MDR7131010.1 ferric-dicitrate binding protein FerR (iron transport regulator) [Algoriphagus sp. 4150]